MGHRSDPVNRPLPGVLLGGTIPDQGQPLRLSFPILGLLGDSVWWDVLPTCVASSGVLLLLQHLPSLPHSTFSFIPKRVKVY